MRTVTHFCTEAEVSDIYNVQYRPMCHLIYGNWAHGYVTSHVHGAISIYYMSLLRVKKLDEYEFIISASGEIYLYRYMYIYYI